ncbi:hypothetical protein [Haladaptatus paucihalophilus]|nr:hypothetical protein [Haladaptatus paucihalophilus]SHJ99374.1 hypothetical protein SAMN05444342_0204 [Haladaptatus paucihalophilus DX253]
MQELGEHYRPAGEPPESNVHRVVGRTDGVTLLRVTDADGRRVNSGEIRRCSSATLDEEFEPARNPDAGFNPVSAVGDVLTWLYWSVRKFL